MTVSGRSRPALHAPRSERKARGTALDPFGRDQLRRLERQVRDDYESTLEHLCDTLSSATHAAAVTVAELPQDIRGYGPVKEAALQRYQQRRRQLHAPLPA